MLQLRQELASLLAKSKLEREQVIALTALNQGWQQLLQQLSDQLIEHLQDGVDVVEAIKLRFAALDGAVLLGLEAGMHLQNSTKPH